MQMIVNTQKVSGPIYAHAAEALALGVGMLEDLGSLFPFLLLWSGDGPPRCVQITDCTPQRAIAAAEKLVAGMQGMEGYAIVADSTVTIGDEEPADAVVARVGVSGGEQGIVAIQRYETDSTGMFAGARGNIAIVGYGDNLLAADG
jgi:hypothetical protein